MDHLFREMMYMKGVASFHLDKLIPDLSFNDSTLVVNPCNSPEQVPITFGAYLDMHRTCSLRFLSICYKGVLMHSR
jgi:hypothetical protein